MTSYFPVRMKSPCRNCGTSKKRRTIENKKLYHISMHCVSKEIGNQRAWMLSQVIFLEVLLLNVNLVMVI